MHVLIIEDDPLTALLLSELLTALGARSLDLAATEAQAVQLASERPPDLVTADVRLEHGDGRAAVAAITRQSGVPFVFVTGNPEAVEAELRPVTVTKPFSEPELHTAIATAFTRSRTADPRAVSPRPAAAPPPTGGR